MVFAVVVFFMELSKEKRKNVLLFVGIVLTIITGSANNILYYKVVGILCCEIISK